MKKSLDEIKNEIISKINLEEYYRQNVAGVQAHTPGVKLLCNCPFHDDKNASMSVDLKAGLWHCFVCNNGGSLFDFYMQLNKCDFKKSLTELAKLHNVNLPHFKDIKDNLILDGKIADDFHEELLKNATALSAFINKRGITEETINKFNIGYDINTKRYTIPVYDERGNLVNIRKYDMHSKDRGFKMLNYTRPALDDSGNPIKDKRGYATYEKHWGTMRLFNVKRLKDVKTILICEGETDAMIAEQNGIPTITITCGAGSFKTEWAKLFKGKIVYICLDLDTAGEKGALRIAEMLHREAEKVFIVQLPPELGVGGDITDFFINFKYNTIKFKECFDNAKNYFDIVNKQEEIHEIRLHETTNADYRSKRIKTEVLVTGKSQPAYMVPKIIKAYCTGARKDCEGCALLENNCDYTYIIDPKKPEVLDLINVSKEKQESAIKTILNFNCDTYKIDIPEHVNIEEIRVVPKLNININNMEYVEKTLYYVGRGIETNQTYVLKGYVYPEPKRQLSTVIIDEAMIASDNIDSFELTDEVKEDLKMFQLKEGQKIGDKLKEGYFDLERNVTHIWGRHDVMFALDLFYHSALYFNYENEKIKGWVNALIIGDTATGKTELITKIREHYGMAGERIGGQGLTTAGLLGTVIQMSSGSWALRWGLLPLNDRRAIIIEEVTDMHEEIMEKLTDIMSSGVVSIVKANGSESTHGRTRLLFVTNTKRGAKLESYGNGPTAIREIIKKDEDIRRMDFILTVAKNEVSADEINKPLDEFEKRLHVYKNTACQRRLMWSWSRKAEQIVFEKDAELEIFAATKRLTLKYHDQFPLIESGDTRNKLRRCAISLAMILVSCNETFEKVIVKKSHVLYFEFWLQKIYDKASMGYDLYSEDARRKYSLTEERKNELIGHFKELPEYELLLKVLWESQVFKKIDIQDRVGYSNKDDMRIVFKWLSQNWLVRSVGNHGYVKESNLTTILKIMLQEHTLEYSNVVSEPEHSTGEKHHKYHKQVHVEPQKTVLQNMKEQEEEEATSVVDRKDLF